MQENLTDKIDHVRQGAADSLENAASSIRSKAAHGIDAIDSIAEGAAGRLDSTAKYVRDYSPACALKRRMSRHPGITLCAGFAAGLFAAYAMRRD